MDKKSKFYKMVLSVLLLISLACGKESERKISFPKIIKKFKDNRNGVSDKKVKERTGRLDAYFELLKSRKAFNGVVLVAEGDHIFYEKAFGYANYRTKEPLSTNTVFQIASVSKQFTAAAIMLLKQQGKLSFDDTIQKFYPDFPYLGITIRQLLTHHSGLSNYTYFCDKVCDRKTVIDNQTVMRLLTEQKPAPYFQPGVRYDYSNTGYIILASIVEKVSKLKFEDFMRKNIFLPCKMMNTYVYNHGTPVEIPNYVEGYNYGRRKVGKTYLDGVVGDKGVYSNVRDLYRWNRVLFTDSLFKPALLEEAYKPAYPDKKNKDNYGFGWRIKDHDQGKIVWHSGWWEGYKSIFLRNLKDETVIIILTNSLAGHLKSEEILGIYYDENYSSQQEGKSSDNE